MQALIRKAPALECHECCQSSVLNGQWNFLGDRTPHKFGGIDCQSDEEENQTQGCGMDESDAGMRCVIWWV
jgi:hypothetical protein